MSSYTKGLHKKNICPYNYMSSVVEISFYRPKNVRFLNSKSGQVADAKLSKCLHDLQPSFFRNNSFHMKKIDSLRQSLDWKLTSSNMSRNTQKHLFGLCMSQILTVLVGKIWGNLS